jgi:SAM-dependent methyltransferase
MNVPTDVWAAGQAYEPYIGRWSRLVASRFVAWLAPLPGARCLDVGCGTGALTATILDALPRAYVCSLDASSAYVAFARSKIADQRATFGAADAQSLPVRSASVDLVISGLMLNFVPDPARALAEMSRVVRPGGTVAVYVWDYAGEMQLIRHFWDAAVELDARAASLDVGPRFPICKPGALEALFLGANLIQVESRAIDVPTTFRNFADYWDPFLGGQGPAPAYAMSLSDAHRMRLRDRLRSRLPTEADGSIALIARAWAVRGYQA